MEEGSERRQCLPRWQLDARPGPRTRQDVHEVHLEEQRRHAREC